MTTTGIVLSRCIDCEVTGFVGEGIDVGIHMINSNGVIKDSDFLNVTTAVKGTGWTSIDAQNLRHQEPLKASMKWDAPPLDLVKSIANAYV
ncbi:hypothetical protein [Pseudomonas brassicacearum]|uniref:hypothetical protein n=1 Tax=Pseudomonas brassicacearum TaxID=930166 RepID=UPI001295CBD6|nr:hypothetical protein [Pseudomonas brassicacearum]QGA51080.1 hypothetical protein GFU70_18785 [Pseudomonas brassicacearum]